MLDGRVAPHSRDAEEGVIGGILIDNKTLSEVAAILKPPDFYVEAHQVVYEAMIELAGASQPIDMITLSNALRDSGDLERLGGNAWLAKLIDATPTTANITSHAQIVSKKAVVRRTIFAAKQVIHTGFDSGADPDDAIDSFLKTAEKVRKIRRAEARVHTLADVMADVEDQYERTKRGELGVPFPWETMTNMTLGLWPGTLTFFVARPGIGKSWTAVFIAWHAWMMGYKILIVSPEMTRAELGERVAARHGRINYGNLVAATLGMFEEQKFYETTKELRGPDSERFLIIDDEDHLEPRYIENIVDDEKPAVILVDSVYMMRVADGGVKTGPGSKGGRYDRILATVDWLRTMARRTMIPVVGVSQLAREGAKLKKGQKKKVKQGTSTGGLEGSLAMTDTILWDVNNLFAMYCDDDMRLHNQMMYVPLKVRRQAKISGVVTTWDMATMNFEEVGTMIETDDDFDDPNYSADIPF